MQVGEDPGDEMGRGTGSEKAFTGRGRGGGGEGGSGGVTRAGDAHRLAAGRALVEGEVLAAGRGEGISQAGGGRGGQARGAPQVRGVVRQKACAK